MAHLFGGRVSQLQYIGGAWERSINSLATMINWQQAGTISVDRRFRASYLSQARQRCSGKRRHHQDAMAPHEEESLRQNRADRDSQNASPQENTFCPDRCP